MQKMYTPPEVAQLVRVSRDKVLNWIRSGKLKATNVSNGTQPRYRIAESELEAFMLRMAATVEEPPPSRRRADRHRIELLQGVKDYFPHIK